MAMVTYAEENHGVSVLPETVEEHATHVGGETYDAIVLSAVLEHVHNPDTTIAAIGSVARPGRSSTSISHRNRI